MLSQMQVLGKRLGKNVKPVSIAIRDMCWDAIAVFGNLVAYRHGGDEIRLLQAYTWVQVLGQHTHECRCLASDWAKT